MTEKSIFKWKCECGYYGLFSKIEGIDKEINIKCPKCQKSKWN